MLASNIWLLQDFWKGDGSWMEEANLMRCVGEPSTPEDIDILPGSRAAHSDEMHGRGMA
tara:strand:+ start:1117 stop:1293 length:177 start_codon:yes stop_codon:yes gene_type:complete